jgi:hypothetical protein
MYSRILFTLRVHGLKLNIDTVFRNGSVCIQILEVAVMDSCKCKNSSSRLYCSVVSYLRQGCQYFKDWGHICQFLASHRPPGYKWKFTENPVLKMEAICPSETLISTYESKWCKKNKIVILTALRMYTTNFMSFIKN